MKRNSVLFAAFTFALCVGFSAGTANAAWTIGATNTKVLVTANAVQLNPAKAAVDVVYTLGTNEALVINDTITIDLTGGLKFAVVAPTLAPSAGTVQLIAGGAAGDTSATWRVTAGIAAGSTLTLNSATAAIFDCTGIADKAKADLLLTLKAGGTTQMGIVNSLYAEKGKIYIFTGAQSEAMTLVPRSNTADVSASPTSYAKFMGSSVAGAATTVTFTNSSGATTLPATMVVKAKKILYILKGNFSGISKVAGAPLTGSDSTGVTTGGTAGQFLINTAKDAAYAVNTANLASSTALTPAPAFTLDGTTAQVSRSFTCEVDVLQDGTIWDAHTAQPAKTLYTIDRNGVSFSANSIGQYNTIKITDTSGSVSATAGKIIIAAYDAAGNKLTPKTGAKEWTVTSNQTTTIAGADLIANYDTLPMRYEFAIQTATATCTNVKNTPSGFSSTVFNSGGSAL